MSESLTGRVLLITGAARRLGRKFALACAQAGADIAIHHSNSEDDTESLRNEIIGLGRRAWVFQADFNDPSQAAGLVPLINASTPLHGLVNSAAIFESRSLQNTSLEDWQKHLQINLTAPFLLSQSFARQAQPGARIINILDWRAQRPGADHFPYTVSKAALASMTASLAVALAPNITVNGLALGAILPPSDGNKNHDILKNVPMRRWSEGTEVEEVLLFLLTCPPYITGEIIHVDGGRHLV
ncbi:MAG: SDR family oxidoreductase [Bacteroidota bacterium]